MQNECEDYQAHIAFILSYINDHENRNFKCVCVFNDWDKEIPAVAYIFK